MTLNNQQQQVSSSNPGGSQPPFPGFDPMSMSQPGKGRKDNGLWLILLLIFLVGGGIYLHSTGGFKGLGARWGKKSGPSARKPLSEFRIDLPEIYGFYALDNGKTVALKQDGRPSDFSPNVEFLLYNRSVALSASSESPITQYRLISPSHYARITRMESARNSRPQFEPMSLFDPQEGEQGPNGILQSSATLHTLTMPVKKQPEMLRIIPEILLPPGLYKIGSYGQFSVNRKEYQASILKVATQALEARKWIEAWDHVEIALDLTPTDEQARDLKKRICDQVLQEARQQVEEKRWEEAKNQVQLLQGFVTADTAYRQEGDQIILQALFENPGDGTLLDRQSGLMWAPDAMRMTSSSQEAHAYCSSLKTADHPDWRPPTEKEFAGLVNKIKEFSDTGRFPVKFPSLQKERETSYLLAPRGSIRWPSLEVQTGGWGKVYGILPVRATKLDPKTQFGEVSLLVWAVENGYAGLAQEACRAGGDPNELYKGSPLLELALKDPPLLSVLLGAGARTDIKGKSGVSPLLTAVLNDNRAAVETLMQGGAKADFSSCTLKNSGDSALEVIASRSEPELLEKLLQLGMDVNQRDPTGRTLLISALLAGNTENMKVLVAHQADLSLQDKEGKTALDLLSKYKGPKRQELEALLPKPQIPATALAEAPPVETTSVKPAENSVETRPASNTQKTAEISRPEPREESGTARSIGKASPAEDEQQVILTKNRNEALEMRDAAQGTARRCGVDPKININYRQGGKFLDTATELEKVGNLPEAGKRYVQARDQFREANLTFLNSGAIRKSVSVPKIGGVRR